MPVSVFDLFSVGVGPSSSHTVGPMRAGAEFASLVRGLPVASVVVDLYGSLASTGQGHGTLGAVVAGLMGSHPETVDPDAMARALEALERDGVLRLDGGATVPFRLADIVLHPLTMLPRHPNAMRLRARDAAGVDLADETYYSIGGGFIARDDEAEPAVDAPAAVAGAAIPVDDAVPYPFSSGAELLAACADSGLPISGVALANEAVTRTDTEVRSGLLEIHGVMESCVDRSVRRGGCLPGGLDVRRRAATWHEQLTREDPDHDPLFAMEWVNLVAMAVNEENATGGRVVTAPTNGAAGIIPAVLYYARTYVPTVADASADERDDAVVRFLLTAGAIGSIYKERASISGAEVGCQGEVGSAASMAAAGLAEVLGGTPEQVENAAEIAMEHNLGLTCDPIGGLVQIPCIERNAIAANKAINAARMALRGDGVHHVSLDQVVETMRQTGADMSSKYKETAMGGLAVNVPLC
ncbi:MULTISPECIES: L-serine ammonia-lyase [Curtobacterium]|uniref:L-serine ammonia-lyase n=1 Tax=Curtobacterium TaxID=2034 RepID=UPI00217D6E09|nr:MULTISPECIES: L-serine ammonia-lyase [Curtobacterium]MCS6574050.1 L-serine ammonia-lyase [Curtobacterium flaccumfaciens pv. flaccumfaciens]MCU0152548.1 L-serine ammonia-lyase [Curtobacterium flaccumfaciens pv. poinsettiae]UXN15479.1 L-serine ammonia-lyase [Curtobacterium flaccumfaciens pv. poinsettiae]UXZ57716.1 L-serine ammonia-lyase [Curtobacterium sp. Arg-1]